MRRHPVGRQSHGDAGPGPLGALDGKAAAVQGHQFPADRQPEPGSAANLVERVGDLHERLERLKQQRHQTANGRQLLADRLNEIGLRAASRPVIDSRSTEEILGYNAMGVPD